MQPRRTPLLSMQCQWRSGLAYFGRRFLFDQRGVVLPIVALSLSTLIGFAGVAIDVSRIAIAQSRLSNSLDAAGLAAGSVASTTNLEAIVNRYLEVNLKGQDLGLEVQDVEVTADSSFTKIELAATAKMPTTFMQLFGYDDVTIRANTEVTRVSRGLEIALVLDITGSMWSGSRITQLRSAASDLVKILFGDNQTRDNLFIGIVPYVTSVNIGSNKTAWLRDYNLSLYPANYPASAVKWKGCIEERDSPLDTSDDPPQAGTSTAARATRWPMFFWPDTIAAQDNNWINDTNGTVTINDAVNYSDANGRGPNISCGDTVQPLTNVKSTLLSKISALYPWRKGGTMSNVGLAWGWRLISPKWRGLGWGHVKPGGRDVLPLDYEEPLMDKAVVLMTDGENQFFDSVSADPFYSDYSAMKRLNTTANGGRADVNSTSQTVGRTVINNKTAALCSAMKQKGIIIYTVTFELGTDSASNDARNLFRNCATKPDYYFDTCGSCQTNLQTAFRKIGDSLANLHISQ